MEDEVIDINDSLKLNISKYIRYVFLVQLQVVSYLRLDFHISFFHFMHLHIYTGQFWENLT